jgi:hypothetical protein
VTGYGLYDWDSISDWVSLFNAKAENGSVAIQFVLGIRWLECEGDHSRPTIAEVQNAFRFSFAPF